MFASTGCGSNICLCTTTERKDTLVVARDGTGEYRNIQEAVEAVRAFMDYTVTIYIKNGIYKEKLVIPLKIVLFIVGNYFCKRSYSKLAIIKGPTALGSLLRIVSLI